MIAACERAGVELFVAYYRRFQPHVLKMKELLAARRLGRAVSAEVDFAQPPLPGHDWGWRVQPEVSGGGLFVDVVSHRIDLLVYLLGDPEEVQTLSLRPDASGRVEEAALLAIRFGSGARAEVHGDFAAPRAADRFVITCEGGSLCSERLDGHAFRATEGHRSEEFIFTPYAAPHMGLIRHIERVLLGGETNQASGQDGLLTDWVLDEGLRHRRDYGHCQ
jgi:predicted dehydrogenase